LKTAAFIQGTLSIGWSLKSCRTTSIRTLKTSTPALNIFAPELPHERLNSANFSSHYKLFFYFLALHAPPLAPFGHSACCGQRRRGRRSPFPLHRSVIACVFEADRASFAKDAAPDLGAIVLKSTILSTEARAEAAGPVGAMPLNFSCIYNCC